MPIYRIYWLNENDRITKADLLIADNDRMVREGVRQLLVDAGTIEVWEGPDASLEYRPTWAT